MLYAKIITQQQLQQLENTCNKNNNGKIYTTVGEFYLSGKFGIKQDFIKACKLNYGISCYELGLLYYYGNNVKKNYLKAKQLFKKL